MNLNYCPLGSYYSTSVIQLQYYDKCIKIEPGSHRTRADKGGGSQQSQT